MADFRLYTDEYRSKLWSDLHPSTSKQYQTAPRTLPFLRRHLRQRSVAVKLQRREKVIFAVSAAVDETEEEVVLEEREKHIDHRIIHLQNSDGDDLNSSKILAALSALDVDSDCFPWDPVVDGITKLLHRPDHDGALITFDFLALKVYCCFENVADSC